MWYGFSVVLWFFMAWFGTVLFIYLQVLRWRHHETLSVFLEHARIIAWARFMYQGINTAVHCFLTLF